jgi:thiaminase/transcriptional activator TenA
MIFEEMCSSVRQMMDDIHSHPFNVELGQGTLSQEKFIYYLIQDALYLSDFAKALALTASRLSDPHHVQQYVKFSLEAIQAERHCHLNYISKNNLSKLVAAEQSPACFMYTHYLLKTAALGSAEEAVASLLPCFWVYREVGKKISEKCEQHNPYIEWISLYSGEQFNHSVNAAIDITNQIGDQASLSTRKKMILAFVRSTQLEWLFWDSAYCQEKWEIVGKKMQVEEEVVCLTI